MNGRELLRVRLRWGLTQEEFARQIGQKSRFAVSHMENGRRPVSAQTERLARRLERDGPYHDETTLLFRGGAG